jgi:hypothetical protein
MTTAMPTSGISIVPRARSLGRVASPRKMRSKWVIQVFMGVCSKVGCKITVVRHAVLPDPLTQTENATSDPVSVVTKSR